MFLTIWVVGALAADLAGIVESTRVELGIPGMSAAVALHGELRDSVASGHADVENAVPARRTTVYRIASVSKPITAVAALRLWENGKLDLDAPVQRYCPA